MKHFIKTTAPFLGTIVFGLMNIFCAFIDREEAHPQLLYFGICACIAGLLGLFTYEKA
jgi:hypothetical protein